MRSVIVISVIIINQILNKVTPREIKSQYYFNTLIIIEDSSNPLAQFLYFFNF